MSAYSDWKCGAITYEEYKSEMEFEARRDNYYDGDCFEEYEDFEDEEFDLDENFMPVRKNYVKEKYKR